MKIQQVIWGTTITASLASSAFAACHGYYCQGVIETMTVTSDAAYIRLAGGTTGLTNCTPYSGGYLTLNRNDADWTVYYATILAAYLAKESITIRPDDSSANCTIAYIAVP